MSTVPNYVAKVSELRTDRIKGCSPDSPCYLRIHAAADFLMLEAELQWYVDTAKMPEPQEEEIDWLSAEPFAVPDADDAGRFEGELTITRDCPELVSALLTAFLQLGATCRIDPFEPLQEWDWPRYCGEASEIAGTVSAIREYGSSAGPDGLEQVYIWAIPPSAEPEASRVIQDFREDPWNEHLSRRIDELGVFNARVNSSVCSVSVACPDFEAAARVVCDALRRAGIEIRAEHSE